MHLKIMSCKMSAILCMHYYSTWGKFGITWWRYQMETFSASLALCVGNSPVTGEFPAKKGEWRGALVFSLIFVWINGWANSRNAGDLRRYHCPACRTTLVATRFRVAVICPIIQVPHCIRVFFYFVWFVFINHIFQFYYELCTYCNILDIYLS